VGLRFTPRLKPLTAVRDWLETQVRNVDDSLEPYLKNDAAVVIHWPTFLRRAWAAGGADEYTTQARRVWRMLAPYVRRADPVLASYLDKTPDMLDAVQQHVELMLDSALGRRLCKALVEATTPVRDVAAHKKFSRCLPCLRRVAELERVGQAEVRAPGTTEPCGACAARAQLAKYSSVIGLEHTNSASLGLKFVYGLNKVLPRNPPALAASPAVHDLAWLLAGRSDFDGAWRQGPWVCVNWETYADRLRDNKLRDPDARERVLRVAERFHAVNQEATAVAADPNRTVFYSSKLSAALEELLSPGMQAKRRALADAPVNAFGPRMRQSVQVQYETGDGTVEASIRRHGSRWCIRIPMQLVPGVALPRLIRLQRKDLESSVEEYWWYQRDLQAYAVSLRQTNNIREAAQVEDLLSWFSARVRVFVDQPKVFKDLVFDARASVRLLEASRGERQRLGRFSPSETTVLEEFMHRRGSVDCGRAFRGPLTETEWSQLLELLPFRTRATINAKISELGFEYAKTWGYVNYLKSGYGIAKSSRRRYAWLAKGVPIDKAVV
jgi:hypothetical protein